MSESQFQIVIQKSAAHGSARFIHENSSICKNRLPEVMRKEKYWIEILATYFTHSGLVV